MSPRGDTQRPNAFQRARILCCQHAGGRAVDSFSFVLPATKIVRLEKGTDWSRSAIHWYYMLEYRYTKLISSILLENVSDSKSRMKSTAAAFLDILLQTKVIPLYQPI